MLDAQQLLDMFPHASVNVRRDFIHIALFDFRDEERPLSYPKRVYGNKEKKRTE